MFFRRMGASKVLAFTYNLTEAAQKVIEHYVDMGFLETLPYGFPRPGIIFYFFCHLYHIYETTTAL